MDENLDFISDFNQNDNEFRPNYVPDYQEPFLRYHVDRPEFLFGMDMNNNFWVDQYENDVEPDYPYDRDHRGFNVYGGLYLAPEVKILVGTLREGHISSDKKNHSIYTLLRLDAQSASYGDFRIFGMSRLVLQTQTKVTINSVFKWDLQHQVGGYIQIKTKKNLIIDRIIANETGYYGDNEYKIKI